MPTSAEVTHAERQQLGAVLYEYSVGTHLWVACAVTSLALFAGHVLAFEPSLAALGVVFFSTLLIYNLDTALDLRQSDDGLRHLRAVRLTWLGLGGVLGLLATTHWSTAALVLAGAGVSCLYAVPLGSRGFRMKALPGAKSLVVGSAVAIAVVCVPLVEQGAPWTSLTWSTLALLLTLTSVNATLFDVRDLEQDGARGLRTLPVVLGLKTTRALLGVGAAGALTTIAALEPRLSRPAFFVLATLLPLILLLGPRSPRSAYAWLVDGALFLPCFVTLGQ